MQLSPRTGGTALALLVLLLPAMGAAQVRVDTTTTVFKESSPGELEMLVVTPSLDIAGDAGEHLTLRAGWEADIVTGASVAIVDDPSGDVDAISSATRLDDLRNTAGGGFTLKSDYASLTAGYSYGHESDYRSHGFSIAGRAEMFERNTAFQISYGRGFDRVCNLDQPRAQEAVDRSRLPSSDGCFGGEDRISEDLSIQTFQGSWTQAWAPVFVDPADPDPAAPRGLPGQPLSQRLARPRGGAGEPPAHPHALRRRGERPHLARAPERRHPRRWAPLPRRLEHRVPHRRAGVRADGRRRLPAAGSRSLLQPERRRILLRRLRALPPGPVLHRRPGAQPHVELGGGRASAVSPCRRARTGASRSSPPSTSSLKFDFMKYDFRQFPLRQRGCPERLRDRRHAEHSRVSF